MAKSAFNILHIEDDKAFSHLVFYKLKKQLDEVCFSRVDKMIDVEDALKNTWHIILCDYDLPGFNGLEVLELIRGKAIKTHFFLISGRMDKGIKDILMSSGGDEYIIKDDMQGIILTIVTYLNRSAKV